VDHEIQNHADIGATVWKRRKPMRFDEARPRKSRLKRAEDRVKTLDVPDLQHEPARGGQLRQRTRLSGVGGDRLFDQQVLSFLKQRLANFEMGSGRRRDGGGIDQVAKFFERIGCAHSVLSRDLRGIRRIAVEDCSELRCAGCSVKPGVVFPDMTDPYDTDAQWFHAQVGFDKMASMREVGSEPQP
jgi:hypothetical protein